MNLKKKKLHAQKIFWKLNRKNVLCCVNDNKEVDLIAP
jgi:hypothetical protein